MDSTTPGTTPIPVAVAVDDPMRGLGLAGLLNTDAHLQASYVGADISAVHRHTPTPSMALLYAGRGAQEDHVRNLAAAGIPVIIVGDLNTDLRQLRNLVDAGASGLIDEDDCTDVLGEAVTTIAAGHGWTYPKMRHVLDITSTPAVTLTDRERQIGTLYAESLAGTGQ